MSSGLGEADPGAAGDEHTLPDLVSINVAAAHTRTIALGCGLSGLLGLVAVVSVFTDDVSGGTGTKVGVFVVGSIFLLFGLLPLLTWRVAFRRRRLVLEPCGIRWDDPQGKPWQVAWSELATVKVVLRHRPRSVTLFLEPGDVENFRQRHPDMSHLVDPSGSGERYLLPLGPVLRKVAPIDRGLRAFGGGVYAGPDVADQPRTPPGRLPEVPIELAENLTENEGFASRPPRPMAVEVSIGLVVTYWLTALVLYGLSGADLSLRDAAVAGFWTVILGLWLWRVWLGGAMAISRLRILTLVVGGGSFVGMLWISGLILTSGLDSLIDEFTGSVIAALVPGTLMSAGLVVAGLLLNRRDVKNWSRAGALGA